MESTELRLVITEKRLAGIENCLESTELRLTNTELCLVSAEMRLAGIENCLEKAEYRWEISEWGFNFKE